ncbi:hypothetical protein N9A67_03035 [Rhodobacteraceae bacterium]|nr:hypothetical protein [Paracoccaceae bacterium]
MSWGKTLMILWAGLALGGNMIAAPAKFQVISLSTAQLVQVGRAQFTWLGWAEMTLCFAILMLLAKQRVWPSLAMTIVVSIFAIQQMWLQPMLQIQSDLLMSGGQPVKNHLHVAFILAETLKIGFLIWASRVADRRPTNTQTP